LQTNYRIAALAIMFTKVPENAYKDWTKNIIYFVIEITKARDYFFATFYFAVVLNIFLKNMC
jgi:hypothetical protein